MERWISRKQLGEILGNGKAIARTTVQSWVDTGKIVEGIDSESGNKLIDTWNPVNKLFISDENKKVLDSLSAQNVELANRKKELELQKLEEDVAIKKAQRDKIEGKIIPIDLAIITLKNQSREMIQATKNVTNIVATMIVKKLNGSPEVLAEVIGLITTTINEETTKSRQKSLNQIQQIVSEYSATNV